MDRIRDYGSLDWGSTPQWGTLQLFNMRIPKRFYNDPRFKDHPIIETLAWNVIRCRHPKISKKFFLPRQELLSSYDLIQSKDPEGILLGLHVILTSSMYRHYAHNSYIQPNQDAWYLCFNNRGYIYITKLVDYIISEIKKNEKVPNRLIDIFFGWVLLHTR